MYMPLYSNIYVDLYGYLYSLFLFTSYRNTCLAMFIVVLFRNANNLTDLQLINGSSKCGISAPWIASQL